jgi:hypothetical protein
VDPERSSIYPDRDTGRSSAARRVNLIGLVGLVALSALAPACAPELDTSRPTPSRGSVGEEMFGVICDRVGAQALREDLTGDSFRGICHKPRGGEFADKVDVTKLPALDPEATNENSEYVSVEKQKKNREVAVGRVEALARRRADLVRALDATFPETKIPIKDIDNADETKSCGAPAGQKSGEGVLTEEIADMLGRMGDLYNDGTLPQSTESLARVMDAFKKSEDAQAAWARLSARQGYRPIETALGATRPIIAYPHLRDLSNASLRLLSADSTPYELEPKYDDEGNRIANPGPANAALNKMLEAAHEELLATTPDPKAKTLVVTTDPAGRVVLNRARDNVEIMQEILFASDPAFGGGTPKYIVKRDVRGYAAIKGGAVPSPFIDADKDGLPDVDESGRFKTTNNSLAPSPFPFPGSPTATRDPAGRALAGSQLLYEYVDTSHTFAAQMMSDLKPLVNPDIDAKHETLMDMLGGMHVAVGPRAQKSKSYAGGKSVEYSGIPDDSPMLDLIYAMGTILGSQGVANEPAGLTHANSDTTLALGRELFSNAEATKATARITGAMITAFDIAQKHDEAKIPRTATFWDESLETMGKMAKEPGLLEDVFAALADDRSAQLGTIFSRYANLKDEITYNKNDINGGPFNLTTNSTSEMKTPVDRAQPETGKNRSAMYRFLQLISDTTGVTACNKPGAKVHAKAFGISLDLPIGGGTFAECEVFKLENLAGFYLDAIADAAQYEPDTKANKRGTFYMRDSLLRNGVGGLGAASVGLMEDSSGLTGFWTPTSSTVLSPKPSWLNRLVFFDLKNDTVNAKTNTFIKDLQGDFIGTSVCPERIITDPKPDEVDATSDGKVHGLRNCPNGQWLQQRGPNTLFTWENFGFYEAMKPLLGAFVKHGREDLFLELANATYKHWPGAEGSADECRLAGNKMCPKAGMNTYEPLIAEALAGDVIPALTELSKVLVKLEIKRCDTVDPTTKACTASTLVSGADVAAAATRSMLDPDYAKNVLQLKDRKGATTAKRNDGTTVPQVTPAYLLTSALGGIDIAFDTYEQQHPEDKDRRANWRRARSQLVDQFMGVSGAKSTSTFANPTMPKMTPVLIDVLRAQLNFHCPKSFAPPFEKCTWAREELAAHAKDTLTGPLASAGLDMMEAIRADKDGRHEMEVLMQYLLDAASKNDALASMLASSNDLVQLMHDDQNLVPLFHVLASAMAATVKDEKGHVKQKSLVDAQMALLAKVSGRYFDKDGKEICRREIDPNQVLAVALGNIVTPITDDGFKGQSPLEVIIDVIADVNRVDPTQPYEGTLDRSDYGAVSDNVVDFLMNKERGLEQFYEVIRQGTKF